MQRPHSDNDFESDRQDESDVSLLDNAQQQTLQQQKKNKDLNGKYMNTRAKRMCKFLKKKRLQALSKVSHQIWI